MSARRNNTTMKEIRTPVDFRVATEASERKWLSTLFASFAEKGEEPGNLVDRMVRRRWIARQRDGRKAGH